jgi:hypothetical protein
MRNLIGIVSLVFLLPTAAYAQQPQPQFGCKDAVHRQFDFWIGDWNVTTPDGQAAGSNVIKAIQDGCALLESWTGAGGGTGTSINYVDQGRWHQLWVSNRTGAAPLRLSGGLERGAMVMTGQYQRPDGKLVQSRMRWEAIADGKVRQTWENSEDGGATWTTVFVGIYTRVSAPRP